jgi:hypothetical protein
MYEMGKGDIAGYVNMCLKRENERQHLNRKPKLLALCSSRIGIASI